MPRSKSRKTSPSSAAAPSVSTVVPPASAVVASVSAAASSAASASRALASASRSAAAELSRWLSRRSAASRAAAEARARAIDKAARPRRAAKDPSRDPFSPMFDRHLNAYGKSLGRGPRWRAPGSFGDLCEISEGRAVAWRRLGCTDREMWEFAEDAPFILDSVVPSLHSMGLSEKEVLSTVSGAGVFTCFALSLFTAFLRPGAVRRGDTSLDWAAPAWTALSILRHAASRRVAKLEGMLMRPGYYERERERRRALAAERRKIRRRATISACPTPEALMEAWRRVRDSKEALVRFGSMVHDLECYVDNSLRFGPDGRITGRNGGVKFWLETHAPELARHYTSVIRYKSAAKKLRQIVGLEDPVPAAAVLEDGEGRTRRGEEDAGGGSGAQPRCGGKCSGGEEGRSWMQLRCGGNCGDEGGGLVAARGQAAARELAATREQVAARELAAARAAWRKAMEGVPDITARVLERIDDLVDPERVEYDAMPTTTQ